MTCLQLAALAGSVTLVGCLATTERFVPTERASSISPTGFVAAQYDVIMGGDVLGEAEIWSGGAFQDEARGYKRTLVHVALRIENNGKIPLRLTTDAVGLRSGQVAAAEVPVTEMDGSAVVGPGEDRVINLFFEMPEVRPQGIDSFQISWALSSPRGEYIQNTPFMEYEAQPAFAYYGSRVAYDPFFGTYLYYPGYYPGPALGWAYTYGPPLRRSAYARPYAYPRTYRPHDHRR